MSNPIPLLVKPVAQLKLSHRAYMLSGAPVSGLLVAASEEGDVTVISPEHTKQAEFKRPHKIAGIAVHPEEPLLAITEGEDIQLTLTDTNGLVVYELLPAAEEPTDSDSKAWGSCFFDLDGEHLWYVAARSYDKIEIQRLDCNTWQVTNSIVIEDAFTELGIELRSTYKSGQVALFLAGGQYGAQVYWVTAGVKGIRCDAEPHLDDTMFPVFSPEGDEFLVIRPRVYLGRYEYPAVRRLARHISSHLWSEAGVKEAGVKNEALGYSVCYLDNGQALIISLSACLYLLDLDTMVVSEAVHVEGHEPKPVPFYYPASVNNLSVCTDMNYFDRFGSTIVFVSETDRQSSKSPGEDTLLFAPLAAFIPFVGVGS